MGKTEVVGIWTAVAGDTEIDDERVRELIGEAGIAGDRGNDVGSLAVSDLIHQARELRGGDFFRARKK